MEILAIDLVGKVQFCHMGLPGRDGMHLLLGAYAETLETLRLHLMYLESEKASPDGTSMLADDYSARFFLDDISLISAYHRTSRFGPSISWHLTSVVRN